MRSGNAVVCGVYRHGGGDDRISVKPVPPCLHGFRTNSYNASDQTAIPIVAIAHLKRHPAYWKNRS